MGGLYVSSVGRRRLGIIGGFLAGGFGGAARCSRLDDLASWLARRLPALMELCTLDPVGILAGIGGAVGRPFPWTTVDALDLVLLLLLIGHRPWKNL